MRECSDKSDWLRSELIDEIIAVGRSGRALATHLRTNRMSTWKRYASDMHRICWWIAGEGIASLSDVSEQTISDQLNTAIDTNCSASMIDGLKQAWTNLLWEVNPRLIRQPRIVSLIKAHKKEAARAPHKAMPMALEYLRKIESELSHNFSFNDLCVFLFLIHSYEGCARFEHLSDARWSDLSIVESQGVMAAVLQHPDGQKQTDASVRIQTVAVDGTPSVLSLLKQMAEEQPAEWPYIYGIRGRSGSWRQLELMRVNDRIKRWMKAIGHRRWFEFSSHSGRRGAATEGYRIGVAGAVIQNAGKWQSDTYREYCDSKHWDGVVLSARLMGVAGAEDAAIVKREMEKVERLKDWTSERSSDDSATLASTMDSVADRRASVAQSEPTDKMEGESFDRELELLVAQVREDNLRLGLPVSTPTLELD